MDIIFTGSVAYDYLMTFPGLFKDYLLADKLEQISLSFLVDGMVKRRGGIAPNIAYTFALLGGKPQVMANRWRRFRRLSCPVGKGRCRYKSNEGDSW
jgi:adenosine kinase